MNWHEIEIDYWRQRLCPRQECPEIPCFDVTSPTRIIESIDQFVVLVMVSNRLITRKPPSEAKVDERQPSLATAA